MEMSFKLFGSRKVQRVSKVQICSETANPSSRICFTTSKCYFELFPYVVLAAEQYINVLCKTTEKIRLTKKSNKLTTEFIVIVVSFHSHFTL